MIEKQKSRRSLSSVATLALALTGFCAAAGVQARPTLSPELPGPVADGTAQRVSNLDSNQRLELAISLPLRDEDGLKSFLDALYDSASPMYRNYLTVAEFTERFGPSAADYDAVLQFAAANDLQIRHRAANRMVVDVSGRVADIERAFGVQIGVYHDAGKTRSFYAPDREPSPALAVQLLHVDGLDDRILPTPHFRRSDNTVDASSGTGSGPNGSFLGSDIRAAYYGGTALTGSGQSVGLLEFGSYLPADIQKYFSRANQTLSVPIVGVSLNGVSATCARICSDVEQALDVEEVISMAPGLKQVVFYAGNSAVSILNQMASDNSSKQLSSSWGWNADAKTVDPIFMEFAAQGQSFLDATGDDGYQLARGVVWPGDDQNVTGVGGTSLVTAGPGGAWQSETGWTYSGGGPSPDGIAIPSYQVPFINAANAGSTTLRNVPDIAGAADNFYSCYDHICSTGNGGTSYAAPLWAGFIALTNQQALSQGKPVVGFLNPTLYTLGGSAGYSSEFHDQTSGNNGKYNAVTGFDLVTGFGSPTGQSLIDALIGGS